MEGSGSVQIVTDPGPVGLNLQFPNIGQDSVPAKALRLAVRLYLKCFGKQRRITLRALCSMSDLNHGIHRSGSDSAESQDQDPNQVNSDQKHT